MIVVNGFIVRTTSATVERKAASLIVSRLLWISTISVCGSGRKPACLRIWSALRASPTFASCMLAVFWPTTWPTATAAITKASQPKTAVFQWLALQRPMRAEVVAGFHGDMDGSFRSRWRCADCARGGPVRDGGDPSRAPTSLLRAAYDEVRRRSGGSALSISERADDGSRHGPLLERDTEVATLAAWSRRRGLATGGWLRSRERRNRQDAPARRGARSCWSGRAGRAGCAGGRAGAGVRLRRRPPAVRASARQVLGGGAGRPAFRCRRARGAAVRPVAAALWGRRRFRRCVVLDPARPVLARRQHRAAPAAARGGRRSALG